MGTITAQILVGQNHTYEGGIVNLSHYAYLSENSMARWTVRQVQWMEEMSSKKVHPLLPRSWIPTVDNMLEDGLLMINLCALRNLKLTRMAEKLFGLPIERISYFYEDISKESLELLYAENRKLLTNKKIIVSVFEGSTIRSQLPKLKHYEGLEFEICTPLYSKNKAPFNQEYVIKGEL